MKVFSKVKRFFSLLLSLIPTPLPLGMAEFDAWAEDVIALGAFPITDKDSIKFAMATMIMHLGPQSAFKPKFYFVLSVRAGAAKQIAAGKFQEIKAKQQAEATAQAQQVASNEVLRNS